MQKAKEAAGKGPASPEEVVALRRAQQAALKGVANMSFGEPQKAREDLCKLLVKVLKSGAAAKKMAACQLLQHVLATPQARAMLHQQQVVPGLVAVCATGARQATIYASALTQAR